MTPNKQSNNKAATSASKILASSKPRKAVKLASASGQTSANGKKMHLAEGKQDNSPAILPQGPPPSFNFWYSPSLDELAAQQGVGPVTDINQLIGGWPGDLDDGFEEAIHSIRKAGMIG